MLLKYHKKKPVYHLPINKEFNFTLIGFLKVWNVHLDFNSDQDISVCQSYPCRAKGVRNNAGFNLNGAIFISVSAVHTKVGLQDYTITNIVEFWVQHCALQQLRVEQRFVLLRIDSLWFWILNFLLERLVFRLR